TGLIIDDILEISPKLQRMRPDDFREDIVEAGQMLDCEQVRTTDFEPAGVDDPCGLASLDVGNLAHAVVKDALVRIAEGGAIDFARVFEPVWEIDVGVSEDEFIGK